MKTVAIIYGSRHGATRGIAYAISATLVSEGLETVVFDAEFADERVPGLTTADAYIVGSGVYMGSWLDAPIDFLQANVMLLATRPVWLFSSGPIPGSSSEKRATGDPLTDALGPSEGPGSGGRKRVAELSERIQPREHRVFAGAYDPTDAPKTMAERLVRLMPGSKGLLPTGDFRDWPAIEAWAREIARALEPSLITV